MWDAIAGRTAGALSNAVSDGDVQPVKRRKAIMPRRRPSSWVVPTVGIALTAFVVIQLTSSDLWRILIAALSFLFWGGLNAALKHRRRVT